MGLKHSSGSSSSTIKWGVIFLHGSGDTGHGLYEWINSTHRHFFSLLDQAHFVCRFPNSPKRPYTLSGGQISSVWHDRVALSLTCAEDTPGILRSVDIVDCEIEALGKEGVPPERIFLWGLSMGGHMALQTSFRSKYASDIAGVVALSCFLSTDSPLWEVIRTSVAAKPALLQRPVLMMHGNRDRLIPLEWGEVTSTRLQQEGLNLSFSPVPRLGHDLCEQQLSSILEWMLHHITTITSAI